MKITLIHFISISFKYNNKFTSFICLSRDNIFIAYSYAIHEDSSLSCIIIYIFFIILERRILTSNILSLHNYNTVMKLFKLKYLFEHKSIVYDIKSI